jgi:hypothetical protein
MYKARSHLHTFSKKLTHSCFKSLMFNCVATKSTARIFFIFRPNKIHISPTGVVSSLSPPWCRFSTGRRCHTTVLYHASFSWSQDKLAASASSSDNVSTCRLPSRAETEVLNSHHRHRPPFPNSLTPTLHCYKKVISILATAPTTQSCLHFASSLGRAPRHQSSTTLHHSLSLSSHAHRPSTQ